MVSLTKKVLIVANTIKYITVGTNTKHKFIAQANFGAQKFGYPCSGPTFIKIGWFRTDCSYDSYVI